MWFSELFCIFAAYNYLNNLDIYIDMKKNILIITLMLLPLVARAEKVEIDGLWYNLIPKGKAAEVVSYRTGSYSGDIVIPESVTYDDVEYSVVAILGAFNGCTNLTSVTIPNSVSRIGANAFQNCSSLTSVTIPNSVTAIDDNAFNRCTGLTSITIPNSVKTIGNYAFYACSSLNSFTIPNGVTSIGEYTFSYCSSLTSITIPDNVSSIERGAFSYCSGLTSVDIPNNVTIIGQQAFEGCSGLVSVTIPNSVINIGDKAFSNCSCLVTLTIPNSVISIGGAAFGYCSALTSVTIGDGITDIGSQAFYNCSSLTTITFGNGSTSFEDMAFFGCSSLNFVHINNVSSWCNNTFKNTSSTPLYYAHHIFINGEEVHDLVIPNDVTIINDYSFYGYSYLNSLTIGNSVSSIGNSAFANCENLADVFCYSETAPTAPNAFGGSYIQYATLHVPVDFVDSYTSTAPWNTIIHIVPIEGEIPKVNKCATPTIEYLNGNVVCNCETADVKYIYEIAPVTVKKESESGRFAFAPTYEIKVYATREGYKDSDTASIIVSLSNVGDVNGDGQVSIADVTSLVNAILEK